MKNSMAPVYAPGTTPSARLEDHDFALYFDGVRVPGKPRITIGADGIGVSVDFATSIGSLTDPKIDATIERAWGGWKPGDSCHLHQPTPKPMPENGFVIIEAIEPPRHAGAETFFLCTAMTAVMDWETEEQVCGASARVAIPASWFQK